MNDTTRYHMTPDEFRRRGHAIVDWIAAYQEQVEHYPVLSKVEPGEIRSQLPDDPPERGEPFEKVMADVERIIMPGVTHWQSPNFFGFFPANASGPAILGELLSAGLGVQGMMWVTSPACTELETHLMDWLVGMLGLPGKFLSSSPGGGVIQDTASSATLCAMLAARERATGFRANESGVRQPLVVYASEQAHSLVEKSVKIAGIGRENLRLIETDAGHAMRADALEAAVEADLQAGLVPCFVNATTGTTSSNAFDPLGPIGEVCERHGLWFHVDAAMCGTAALCPEFRFIHDGLARADSYCFNPHKWMLTNFDCDCFWVADRAALIQTLSVLPEYLKNRATQSGAVFDYRDWHIPLGRRFRALKLWFVIRHYGVEGLRHHVREQVGLAQEFAGRVRSHEHLELATEPPLNLVCFRHTLGDDATQRLLDAVNATGRLYMTHTRLDERLTIRFCVGATNTERRHVEQAWDLIDRTCREQVGL